MSLEKVFSKGELHPLDLKNAVGEYINELVEPVRGAFEKNPKLKKLKEKISGFEVTR